MEEARSYSTFGELESQEFKASGVTLLKILYERDGAGRLVAKSEERTSGLTRFEYGYDQAGRLVSERKILPDKSSLLTQWSYDGNGNRVSEMRPDGTVVSGAYDDQDRVLAYGASTFTHTANGELLSHCQGSLCRHFGYDVFGNLRHVLLESGIGVEYVIDGRNRRIGTKVNGQLVQGFLYDDQLRIVAELDGPQQVVARFIDADGINVPDLMEKNGRTYRLLQDHLGSPRLVVDTASGEVVQELQYDAWGNLVFDSNPGFQPFGFAGGLHDPHTRLIRFGARDYDPHLGRWTTKDPIGFAAPGWNLFDYALGDPVGQFDPSGLAPRCCQCDECPSGKWSYFGGGASVFAVVGVAIVKGTFTCVGKDSVTVPVQGGCRGLGIILAAGIGLEGSSNIWYAEACNSDDLLGRSQGVFSSLLAVSVSSTFGEGLRFGGLNLAIGKSYGAGAAWLWCDLYRRK